MAITVMVCAICVAAALTNSLGVDAVIPDMAGLRPRTRHPRTTGRTDARQVLFSSVQSQCELTRTCSGTTQRSSSNRLELLECRRRTDAHEPRGTDVMNMKLGLCRWIVRQPACLKLQT